MSKRTIALAGRGGAKTLVKGKSLKKRLLRYKWLYLMMIPGVVWLICFHLLPLYGISIAFFDYKIARGLSGSEFVGFRNFRLLFSHPDFLRILFNTLKISLLALAVGFPAPILLALSVNTIRKRTFKNSFQTISFLPNFISWVVIYGMSNIIFSNFNGALSNIFGGFGWKYKDPTTNPNTFIAWLLLSSVWKGVGMGSIVYLAALSGIDPQYYEAAEMDGASRTRQLFSITIPFILPTSGIVLILSMGGLLSSNFEQLFLYLQGGDVDLLKVAETFDIWVYRNGITNGKYALSTALDIFRSGIGVILIFFTNFVAKKMGHEGVW